MVCWNVLGGPHLVLLCRQVRISAPIFKLVEVDWNVLGGPDLALLCRQVRISAPIFKLVEVAVDWKALIIQRKIYSYSEFNDVALVLEEKRSLQKKLNS